jgi:FAD:protein FMN transferase
MGTIVSISVYSDKSKDELKKLSKKAFDIIKHYEDNVFSFYKKSSFTYKINKRLKKENLKVKNKDLLNLIKISLKIRKKTNGLFDITYKSKIKNKIKVYETYALIKKGTILDFGGIAKGYIINKVKKFFLKNKINNFLINAGGDILTHGMKGKRPWTVEVLNPSSKKNYLRCKFNKENVIFTSGSYYRFKEKNAKVYTHIVNPKTNSSLKKDIKSVSLIGKDPSLIDGLCTSTYLIEKNNIKKHLSSFQKQGIGVIIILENNKKFINGIAKKHCRLK